MIGTYTKYTMTIIFIISKNEEKILGYDMQTKRNMIRPLPSVQQRLQHHYQTKQRVHVHIHVYMCHD